MVYLIKNCFFFCHVSETEDAGPVLLGIDITLGLCSRERKNVLPRIISEPPTPSPDTDGCLLGKVVIPRGKKALDVGAGLTERILEVIVLV